jgi:hypothetical protein
VKVAYSNSKSRESVDSEVEERSVEGGEDDAGVDIGNEKRADDSGEVNLEDVI